MARTGGSLEPHNTVVVQPTAHESGSGIPLGCHLPHRAAPAGGEQYATAPWIIPLNSFADALNLHSAIEALVSPVEAATNVLQTEYTCNLSSKDAIGGPLACAKVLRELWLTCTSSFPRCSRNCVTLCCSGTGRTNTVAKAGACQSGLASLPG